jgi:hypothetical protein
MNNLSAHFFAYNPVLRSQDLPSAGMGNTGVDHTRTPLYKLPYHYTWSIASLMPV